MYVRLFVRPHGATRLPPDGFSWHLTLSGFFSKICRENASLIKNLKIITCTLHKDQYKFMIISGTALLKMKSCRKIKPYSSCPTPRKSCPLYEIVWKHIVESDKPQVKIWSVRIAYWITKAKNTHSEYVILLSTAPVVARTCLDVTLYVYCLSCSGITGQSSGRTSS